MSPALSTTGLNDKGESKWMDEFLGNCTEMPDCDPSLIKYIAFHDYNGDVKRLEGRIAGVVQRYGRKVWLTEVAVGKWNATGGPSREAEDGYMKELLPALDANDNVFRYAWYTSRNPPNDFVGGSSLLPYDSNSTAPTSTGQLYRPQS